MRGPYKAQSLELLKSHGLEIGTVFDVGVQSGTFELMTAFPNARHVLFEPVAEFLPQIEAHYAGILHEVHNVAVSDCSGEATLAVSSVVPGVAITHSTLVSRDVDGRQDRTVRTVALDDFVAGRDYARPYLLKVDIDGHELRVLRGAEQLLRNTDVLIVETPKDELVQRLAAAQNLGFEIFDLSDPCYYDDAFWQCDAIMIRSDLHRKYFRQLGTDIDIGLYHQFRMA